MAGSWKQTITSPFRKACTILSPQHPHQASASGGGGGGGGGGDKQTTTRAGRRHGAQLKGSSSSSSAVEYGGEAVDTRGPETEATSTQLYGDVMACGYEDVQVMWSMLDNKARVATS